MPPSPFYPKVISHNIGNFSGEIQKTEQSDKPWQISRWQGSSKEFIWLALGGHKINGSLQ